jgi:hypothetical protein
VPPDANLLALAGRDPVLARQVGSAAPDPRIVFTVSRTGKPVPCVQDRGRTLALHSLVDPQREGERLAASAAGAGFVVSLGLGAGYHLLPLLSRKDLSALVVVERDPQALAALLSGADLQEILADPRVTLSAGLSPSRLCDAILQAYSPVLCGSLCTLPLRPWCDAMKDWAAAAAAGVREAAQAAGADFATQARFGRRWFSNILANMPLAERSPLELPRSRRVLVTAAGPSLEDQMPALARQRGGALLVAVDTSLPALEAAGIRPDLVVSIDCQVHSAYHFYAGRARQERLVLDLASPPSLARMVPRTTFAASAHPLCALLARQWRPFPPIDVTGGNVTHAAVSLAGTLGAESVVVYGADFSYPDGKPYARGTYLFDWFGCRADRLAPAETSFFSFLYRAGDPVRERLDGSVRYTTALLLAYRDSLQELAGRMSAEVSAAPGRGLTLRFSRAADAAGQAAPNRNGDSSVKRAPRADWREFLRGYARRLFAAPAPAAPPAAWLARLEPDAREAWQTVLPVAAAELREQAAIGGPADGQAGADALGRARGWALARISRALSEDDSGVAHE